VDADEHGFLDLTAKERRERKEIISMFLVFSRGNEGKFQSVAVNASSL
jgi:hypothetical protein